MKGIILGGGLGTRLYPITKAINKHLLNLYDKPVIYYPLSTLMSLGINEILLITQKNNIPFYKKILGNGNDFGIKLNYAIQNKPGGLTEAFTIGAKFIDKDSVALILGDNIFISETFTQYLSDKIRNFKSGGIILANKVADPKPFGVVTFDKNFNVINVEEKPTKPKSNYIIPGLYFFDNNVVSIAKKITPSHRGEKEITSVINKYLENKTLKTIIMPKDTLWSDIGSINELFKTTLFIKHFQNKHHKLVGSPELTAYQKKWISNKKLHHVSKVYEKTHYGEMLKKYNASIL